VETGKFMQFVEELLPGFDRNFRMAEKEQTRNVIMKTDQIKKANHVFKILTQV